VTTPFPDAPPLTEGAAWHRLHPLSPFVRAGRQMMSLVIVLFALAVLNERQARGDVVIDAVVIGIALAGGFISWLVTRWQIAGDVLRVETGLLRRDSRRIPLSQVQAVDVSQSGFARVLGLAELQLRVAGGDSERGGSLACLRVAEAEELRRQLLALAGAARRPARAAEAGVAQAAEPGAAEGTAPAGGSAPTAAPTAAAPGPLAAGPPSADSAGSLAGDVREAAAPGRQLFRVRAGRLPAAIVLTASGVRALVIAAAAGLTVQLTGSPGVLGPFLPVVLGVVLALWRHFNGEYATTIVAAPDGIRLSSGLIQRTAETIRPGRIQAVRLVEPLAWRPFGWCRLEVDVAGARQRHENQAEGQRLRALIPVGSRAEADEMLAELLSCRPVPDRRPPRRVIWKAPLGYHFLGWSGDERYVVASRGRVSRQTTWVPLEKMQSVRWVQGPWQRRLGLATVRLDVAGKRVSAKVSDRDAAEALEILGRLPDLARAARARAS
jgi:putative membrane protein